MDIKEIERKEHDEMSLCQIISGCEQIVIYSDGEIKSYEKGADQYNDIMASWTRMTDDALEMPAYGVSLDELTRREMTAGLWVEFEFKERLARHNMPFEKLLVKVEEGYRGFNLIRYTAEAGYSGRCFYLQLNDDKNMSDFAKTLKNI